MPYVFLDFLLEVYGVVVLKESSHAWIQNVDSRPLSEEAHVTSPVETTPWCQMHQSIKRDVEKRQSSSSWDPTHPCSNP